MKLYAVITWRKCGPLKSTAELRAAQRHNLREEPQPHCEPNGPAPYVLNGSADLVEDVRARLAKYGLDLSKIRKNGVIAYEAVITASREFFERGTPAERQSRIQDWGKAVVDFVYRRFSAHRIVQLVLHTDELTPHFHLIVLPLTQVVDNRRRERAPRWSLVGRTISGPGEYDRLQTDFARAMAPFGLERGEIGSGRKYRPVREYMADIERKQREAEEEKRRAEEEIATAAAERALLKAQRAAFEAQVRSVIADLQETAKLQARLESRREALRADRDTLLRRAAELDGVRDALRALPDHHLPDSVRSIRDSLFNIRRPLPTFDPLPPEEPDLAALRRLQQQGAMGR